MTVQPDRATSGEDVDVDLLIVGAGPVGIYGAYYAGARGLSVAVLDSLSQVGGQVTAMYPEKAIYDVAALPEITGRALIAGLVAQAARYQPAYLLGEQARDLVARVDSHGQRRLIVHTDADRDISCGAVVVTGGIGTFTPRPLAAALPYLGRGMAHFVVNPEAHRDQHVVVVGGGDSAIDWCLTLEPIAASVTLVHRRTKFRAHPASVAAVHASQVQVITDAQVVVAEGTGALESVEVQVAGEQATRTLRCEALIAALGFTANLGPLRGWGMTLHDNRQVVVSTTMATDVPGVFAAGDITHYPGKVRLISVGFGEVATAINNAAVLLNPDLALFPGHSSDQPLPISA